VGPQHGHRHRVGVDHARLAALGVALGHCGALASVPDHASRPVDAQRARVEVDLADGAEHDEGVLDGPGLRAESTDWTPAPAAGIVGHSLRQVFGAAGPLHPLAEVGKYAWRPHEVEARADGLKVPTPTDAGAVAPEAPPRVAARATPVADLAPPRKVPAGDVSGFQRARRHERKTR
jgi:hypothetical protein